MAVGKHRDDEVALSTSSSVVVVVVLVGSVAVLLQIVVVVLSKSTASSATKNSCNGCSTNTKGRYEAARMHPSLVPTSSSEGDNEEDGWWLASKCVVATSQIHVAFRTGFRSEFCNRRGLVATKVVATGAVVLVEVVVVDC